MAIQLSEKEINSYIKARRAGVSGVNIWGVWECRLQHWTSHGKWQLSLLWSPSTRKWSSSSELSRQNLTLETKCPRQQRPVFKDRCLSWKCAQQVSSTRTLISTCSTAQTRRLVWTVLNVCVPRTNRCSNTNSAKTQAALTTSTLCDTTSPRTNPSFSRKSEKETTSTKTAPNPQLNNTSS